MHPRYLFLILILFATSLTYAQSANDECTTAIPLSDVTNWCSGAAAFSSVGATESTVESPGCFPNTQTANDVWFSFVAQASNVSIGVTGNIANSPSTLNDPQFALYTGSCGSLVELTCQSDAFNANQITAIQAGLEAGETYYIRVSAREGQTGTFELCVNNFSEVPPPDGDCPTGVLLCDRSPFTVDFVSGVGEIPNEIAGNACDDVDCGSALQESSSTWYKWICDEPGPLAFTLTPLNPADDLDFIVFELPNGIDDCSGMEDLRCMFSGENVGSDFADWAPCYGPTGLSQADPDRSESCGCQPGNNNFAAAVQMEAGKAYALVINNYSQSGAGFSIEFDQSPGTGTFLGPEAAFAFTPEVACVGETVTYSDASSFIGTIDTYTWNFGADAEPRTATGIGPHDVVYNTPGLKTVLLEVTTDRGCIVSRVELATEVICCDDHFMVDADVTNLACPDINDGAIDLTITNDYGPYIYAWDTEDNSEDLNNLEPGEYAVRVQDQAGCELELAFNISTPPSFAFDTLVVMPTCDGGTDGAVTLEVEGGTGPYEWNWENTGFQSDNTLPNIMQGDYEVVVRDANGCIVNQTLPVRELELLLDPAVQAIEMPSCFGFSDGSITIAINNGLPSYQYNFNDGNGFVNNNMLSGVPAGIYQVDVLDANRCQGNFELVVEDHPPLTLGFEVENVSCFGEEDGVVASLVTGGFGDYRYSWSNSASTANINNLPAGTYAITVLDENDCVISGDTIVVQPDSLGLDLVEVIDNICFGENNGSATVAANGGNPPYEYSTDGNTFQMSPVLENLPAGTYDFTVLDALGCTAEVEATITEPAELFVNIGGDRLIQLGFDTIVNAFSNYSPVSYEWSPIDSLNCLNMDCSTVEVNPTSTTTYTVTVINENGCEAINTVTIRVIKDRPVYVPNIFSPNLDGQNDGFTIYGGRGLSKIEKLQIFSRWGSLVFETTNIDPNDEKLGWDGTFLGRPVNPGVFVYVAQVRFVDDSVVQLEGDVTLIR